ncbi:MAG: hypothetical protein ING91_19380 [Rhodocyclaceae bacterium]|nr:hypothetical protein [Rhodocyclaceae bacterium]MCA3116397.1 hypothetical protein [Rhodocyclaceae bacterium]MCA3127072.1 hypothetical protein [Rhodocyclaceae bacterium]
MNDAAVHRREFIEERAAIREFDGRMPRSAAEVMARLDWQERQRPQPPAPDPNEAPAKKRAPTTVEGRQ